LLTYGHLKDLTACITDSELPENYRILCRRGDTELIVAETPSRKGVADGDALAQKTVPEE
jgi:hypothetical protein